MSEMIDRVAKALCVANADEGNDYAAMARVAIEAMREPTDKMVEALYLHNCGWGLLSGCVAIWHELIDTALAES